MEMDFFDWVEVALTEMGNKSLTGTISVRNSTQQNATTPVVVQVPLQSVNAAQFFAKASSLLLYSNNYDEGLIRMVFNSTFGDAQNITSPRMMRILQKRLCIFILFHYSEVFRLALV